MREHDKTSDAVLLDMLELVAAGNSRSEIADIYGRSRNSVIGILSRIALDTDSAEAALPPAGQALAVKPENRDGGLPARWWVAGLRKQARHKAPLRQQTQQAESLRQRVSR